MHQLDLKIGKKKIRVKPMFGMKKYIGLIFWRSGNVLLPNGPIHTFFCKPMKLIYIKNSRIVKIIRAKPWRTFKEIEADYILETTENIKLKVGMKVYGLGKALTSKAKRSNRKRR